MEVLTDAQYKKCLDQFIKLEEYAISMNHYQLARETHINDARIWKAFLIDPRTVEYIQSESDLIRKAAITDIIRKAPGSKSVGQAQLINSLLKVEEQSVNKDGPVFVYCYVPLNNEQKFSPNVLEVDNEPTNTEFDWGITDELMAKSEELPEE